MEKDEINGGANPGAGENNLSGLGFNAKDLGIKPNDDTNNEDDVAKAAAAKLEEENKKKAEEEARLKAQQNPNDTQVTGVRIDDQDYVLDKDGNALDKDGKVFKTKEELTALENEDDEIPLVDEIILKAGYELKDKDGNPKKYSDSIEGILEAANDIAEIKLNKAMQEAQAKEDARVKAFKEFIAKGGNEKEYFQHKAVSWKDTKFNDEPSFLESAILEDFKRKGISKEQAERTLNLYKDSNSLKEFGKLAYDNLVKNDTEFEKKREEFLETRNKQEQEATKAHWTNVEQVIKKGTLNNITIPESERPEFFKYIALAVDEDGNSQADLDETTVEQSLQLAYLKYKKFDLSKLIQAQVKKERVISLRSKLSKNEVSSTEGAAQKVVKPGDFGNLSLDSVLTGKSK